MSNIETQGMTMLLKTCTYIGPKVTVFMAENNVSEHDIVQFRKRYLDFLVECAAQIYKRFPLNDPDVKALGFLL